MRDETKYAYDNARAVQSERLAALAEALDPGTVRHLDSIGVGRGWRCLEVGAGGGSIAAWLSERVAGDGAVVATDLDTTVLRELWRPNLEIRVHDVLEDDLPEGEFDLVHVRLLLGWLSEPQRGAATAGRQRSTRAAGCSPRRWTSRPWHPTRTSTPAHRAPSRAWPRRTTPPCPGSTASTCTTAAAWPGTWPAPGWAGGRLRGTRVDVAWSRGGRGALAADDHPDPRGDAGLRPRHGGRHRGTCSRSATTRGSPRSRRSSWPPAAAAPPRVAPCPSPPRPDPQPGSTARRASGFEVVVLRPDEDGCQMEGQTAAVEDSEAWAVGYAIALDRDWVTGKRARVSGPRGHGPARGSASRWCAPVAGWSTASPPRTSTAASTSTSSPHRSRTRSPSTTSGSRSVRRPRRRRPTSGRSTSPWSGSSSATSTWEGSRRSPALPLHLARVRLRVRVRLRRIRAGPRLPRHRGPRGIVTSCASCRRRGG